MPFYGNDCIQTWVIDALEEHFELLEDDEKIDMMDYFRDDEGWFDEDKWGKIAWNRYEDILMDGINNDMLTTAIKHSFLNEEEDDNEFHNHMRRVFEEWREENLTKKTEEEDEYVDEPCSGDEDDYDYHECTDHKCRYKGHWHKKSTKKDEVDGDGFRCDECGKDGVENDDTTYAMDGTFCNEGCLQNHIDLLREEAEKKVNLTIGA